MAPKSAHILFAILSVVAVAAASEGTKAGGWKAISNPNTPEVVAVAKFAVAEHNKEKKTPLVFVSVVKAEFQVVAGVNYRLLISAKHGTAVTPETYVAVVNSSPSRSLSLVSFHGIVH
ncbi:cysteine proteinase inhibitor 1-like [Salvia miltiorrhiza]|uniref:cysteine proteinase inhibitor 1-like n=1 Tax=Salvia miltiorrhiza TaxID=226208 RepID=UPI0025ACD352|nr:cysteine proteinase inhibitor 1-like [Salvia miltiorrhiza]